MRYLPYLEVYHEDWPTENHDFHRTGVTLLEGDIKTELSPMRSDFVLASNISEDTVVRPSVGDIDNNGKNDVVSVTHDINYMPNESTLYVVENTGTKPKLKFGTPITVKGGAIMSPPTIADIDGDSTREIIVGGHNGTVFAYDRNLLGSLTEKWHYSIGKKWVPSASMYLVDFGGGVAVGDVDANGDQEVVFTDHYTNKPDYPASVYVLNGQTGALKYSYNYSGNGTPRNVSGAFGPVSLANIDSDDYLEIIVPAYYGILVFDYSAGALSLKCSNTHGRHDGSAVVIDVDRDNQYELVYSTSTFACAGGKTCLDATYIVDAQTCAQEGSSITSYLNYSRVTPAVADVDQDLNLEIILSTGSGGYPGYPPKGEIRCYDASSRNLDCLYTDGGTLQTAFVSPSVADIDGLGDYEIIIGENNGTKIHIINPATNTTKFKYNFSFFIDSAVAIADIDNTDGMAEIAVKRAGSPITLLAMMGANNSPPVLNGIRNITALAGALVNLNSSGEVTATDPEGDPVSITFSSPINATAAWQTTENDTIFNASYTDYLIQVQATDNKNLTTTGYVEVKVFNSTSHLQNNFTDGTSQKSFNYTQPGNKTVYVRLPKDVVIQYAKLKLEGSN